MTSLLDLSVYPSLAGKVIIVTGGNAGIGFYTVKYLGQLGAKVYMGARNETKAKNAIAQLNQSKSPGFGEVIFLKMDLSDPRSTKKAANCFLQLEDRLDILINNAGMLPLPYHLTEDGLSDIMVTNHISPFLFTDALLPIMKKTASSSTADVRIINVSSYRHRDPRNVAFDSRESLNRKFSSNQNGTLQRYGLTKLANILHVKELQRRLDADNCPITCVALHPGEVRTRGALDAVGKLAMGGMAKVLLRVFSIAPDKGALTSLFAAASPVIAQERQKFKGSYLIPYGRIKEPSPTARDAKLAADLWKTTKLVISELHGL